MTTESPTLDQYIRQIRWYAVGRTPHIGVVFLQLVDGTYIKGKLPQKAHYTLSLQFKAQHTFWYTDSYLRTILGLFSAVVHRCLGY